MLGRMRRYGRGVRFARSEEEKREYSHNYLVRHMNNFYELFCTNQGANAEGLLRTLKNHCERWDTPPAVCKMIPLMEQMCKAIAQEERLGKQVVSTFRSWK